MKGKLKSEKLLVTSLSALLIVGSSPVSAFALDGVVSGKYTGSALPAQQSYQSVVRRKATPLSAKSLNYPIPQMVLLGSGQPTQLTFEDLVNDNNIDQTIANINKKIENKETDISKAEYRVNNGVKAFLEWAGENYPQHLKDVEKGRAIIEKYISLGDVDLAKKTDAGSYENFLRTADFLERQNYLRVNDEHFNCEKQHTSFDILCKAIVSANRSTDPRLGHRHTFKNIGENLAWGSETPTWNDPFNHWYFAEKIMWEFQEDYITKYKQDHPEASDEDAKEKATEARKALNGTIYEDGKFKGEIIFNTQIGHYTNMLNDCAVAAIAVNTDRTPTGSIATYAMNASYSYKGNEYNLISEEEYREIIENYKKATNKDEINKEISKLKENLALANQAKAEQDAQKAADLDLKTLEDKKGDVTDQEIAGVQAKIDKVTIGEKKSAFNTRLEGVKKAKDAQDAADEAIKALEARNGDVDDQQIADAQAKIDKVTNEKKKNDFNARLNAVKDAKAAKEADDKEALDEAKELVAAAENEKTQSAYDTANTKVKGLNSSGAKRELQARLADVAKYIAAGNALTALEGKDIGVVTQEELTNAEKSINSVKAVWKQSLSDRLTILKNNKKADDDRKAEEARQLTQAKETAKAVIGGLGNLNSAEQSQHITKVNEANSIDDVNKAVLDAQKANGKNVIAGLNKLTDAEKTTANEAIDNAVDEAAINAIVTEAQKKQSARQSLEEHKNEAKTKIDPLAKLSKAEKDAYKDRIDKAASKEAADSIVLDAQKVNAKKVIAELNKLTNDEKTTANQAIDNAGDEIAINTIVSEAQAKQTERVILDENKAKAKAKVDALDKLTKDEKDTYKDRIDQAPTKEAADEIALEAQQANGKKVIAGLDKLSEEEKAAAERAIDGASNEGEINGIVQDAQNKQKERQSLEDHKNAAKAKVDALEKLTQEEKDAYKNEIDEATSKEQVDPVVLRAQKDNAKKKVAELGKLNEEEKAEAEQAIDHAQNEGQIEGAVKKAEASNITLDEAKAKAKEEIKALGKLSASEKASYETKIDKAESKAEVNAIVVEAQRENANKQKSTGSTHYWIPGPAQQGSESTSSSKPESGAVSVKLNSKLVIGSKTLKLTVNGVEREVQMDVSPYIENNRTMLPIRFMAETLGFKVDWDQGTRTVILTDKNNVVKLPVGTKKIIVNGDVYESDVKTVIKHNRTMLPIANVARALGLKDGKDILWDETTREVVITREIVK